MRGLLLQDLPLEIIANIASYMPKQTCRRFNQVARASVFSRLSFNSETPGKAHHIVQNLRKETWQHVTQLCVTFYLVSQTIGDDALEDCDWRKPTDVWRELFSRLSDLRKLEVDIHLLGDAEDVLDSAFCRDIFASLCLPATQNCGQSQTLMLNVDGNDKIPVCSPVWLKLWQAFSAYRQIYLDIFGWLGTPTIPDDSFMLNSAGLLRSGALRGINLEAGDEDQFVIASKMPSITSLLVSYGTVSSCRAAWACIKELAPGLVQLRFQDIDNFPVDRSQTAFALPLLEALELSPHDPFAHLEAHLKLVDMPALRWVSMEKAMSMNYYSTSDAEERVSPLTQAGFQMAINELKSIVRFDTSLPPACRERQYTIKLDSTWHFLPHYLQALAPLLPTDCLYLNINLSGIFEPPVMGPAVHTHQTALATFSSESLTSAFLEPCRQALTQLHVDVNQQSVKHFIAPTPIKFARLSDLRLHGTGSAVEWKDLCAVFSNWSLPALQELHIPSDEYDFTQQCATLQDWLPTWPMLRRLTLTRPHVDFRAEASQELQKLQEACKNRTPPVSFTYPH